MREKHLYLESTLFSGGISMDLWLSHDKYVVGDHHPAVSTTDLPASLSHRPCAECSSHSYCNGGLLGKKPSFTKEIRWKSEDDAVI